MLIRMSGFSGAGDTGLDALSKLDTLIDRAKTARPKEEVQAPAAAQEAPAAAEIDFEDPRAREQFIGSVQDAAAEAASSGQSFVNHALDPQRVAALLEGLD